MVGKVSRIVGSIVFCLTVTGCKMNLPPLDLDNTPASTEASSTYFCSEGRTFNAAFDSDGSRMSMMIEGRNFTLRRVRNSKDPAVFTNGVMTLYAAHNPVPTIWMERFGVVAYRNCHQEIVEH